MRFYDVDRGEIRVEGTDIRGITRSSLRENYGMVLQETWLKSGTVRDNISYGKPDATDEEIREAARLTHADRFISRLPNGYDTTVGELGDTLSGGERQRIGIARAFLHNAPFMLLDEPTSNLDSLNEGIILKSLMEECRDRTVVIVSHRDSTMNAADTIFEM
jgi:ATP-binding cassette subfamily C protein